MTRVRTSLIVVNWNAGTAALCECLRSVEAEGAQVDETILVDNAADDGSLGAARALAPWVTVIEMGANLGFAQAANRGALAASGDVLVFLNPDARLLPGAVSTLLNGLSTTPGAGIAGGGLVDSRGRWRPSAARFAPARHLLLDTTVGRLPSRLRRKPYVVDWVYGTFMAVRREVFLQLGGFDPAYFCYGEDMDLCHRAARAGVRTILVPQARAVHGSGPSAVRRFGERRAAAIVEGELRFYVRHTTARAVVVFRTIAAAKFGCKALLLVLMRQGRAARGAMSVVRTCLGPPPR